MAGILLVTALASLSGCRQASEPTITLIVETPYPVEKDDTVFVAGNLPSLGLWRPDGYPLAQTDPVTWNATIDVPPDTALEFKITRGSWETEAVAAEGEVPDNHALIARSDTTIHIRIAAWKDVAGVSFGQVTGRVDRLTDLQGDGIRPRNAIVWLPPGYDEQVDRRYPVLYVHDGQNLFDPRTSYTGIDWQIDEHADSLGRGGRMQEIIVVGIENTADRSKEYDDTITGRAYLDFLVDTLKPRIDASYRTRGDRANTAVMGSSMGGTISFLAVWYHPDVFSMAACLSPYFPGHFPDLVQQRNWSAESFRLYIDNGDDRLDSRLQRGIDPMLAALEAAGFEEGKDLLWYRATDAPHNERAWSHRVWRPLLFFFGTSDDPVSR